MCGLGVLISFFPLLLPTRTRFETLIFPNDVPVRIGSNENARAPKSADGELMKSGGQSRGKLIWAWAAARKSGRRRRFRFGRVRASHAAFLLENKHRIAEGVKAVFFLHGRLVCFQDQFAAGEGGDQHEQA